MRKEVKYLNILLLAGFICYWCISFYSSFVPGQFSNLIKKSAFGQILFPPTYLMYTVPGKQILTSEYHLFKQNKKIAVVDADSLLKSKLNAQFPSPYADKDIILYRSVFHQPNLYIAGRIHKYAFDSAAQRQQTLQEYILNDSKARGTLNNQLNFFSTIQKENNNFENADSVSLVIHRRMNYIEMDKNFYNKLDAYIEENKVVELGKNLHQ